MEEEAKAAAAKRVAAMLQRPDQLDKVPELIGRVSRKAASVEAMIKSMVGSQLDGIVTGLKQLEVAMEEVRQIEENMEKLGDAIGEVPDLVASVEDVRQENCLHAQLATARDNLTHIAEVPELVSKSLKWIEEGNLLLAHQACRDLENSRDDLLYEVHRTRSHSFTDRDLLKDYFKDVAQLSLRLEKHLMFILLRTFATVRQNPKELVTALRIIEREERVDEECSNNQKQTGFIPPQRPKQWKERCLAKLRESMEHKIEGNQLETRDPNKMWLVRHLEVVRMLMLEDLRIAKHHLHACFPPEYQIFQHCLSVYQSVVAARLVAIIQDGLEGQEPISLLQWTRNTWAGGDLLGAPALGLSKSDISPVLEEEVMQQLVKAHLDKTRDNYKAWMINTVRQEEADWNSEKYPEKDADDMYHTDSPIIVFQMLDETLQVAATVSQDLVDQVFVVGVDQLVEFGGQYRAAIQEYKTMYLKDRARLLPGQFTRNMVAIINNCDRFEVLSQEMKTRWWVAGHHDVHCMGTFEQLIRMLQDIGKQSIEFLLDEAFEDIETFFPELITTSWQTDSQAAVQSTFLTLKDYFDDYKCLKEKHFCEVISSAQDRVARRYITAMMGAAAGIRRKITFNGEEDRREAAAKMKSEASHCKSFFKETAGDMADFDSPFDTIVALAEVLASDEEMLFLELGTLCKKYPDVSSEQIICILLLRGDIGRGDAKQLAAEFVSDAVDGDPHKTFHLSSILAQVDVTSNIADKLNPFAGTDKLNPFAGTGKEVVAGLSVLNAFTIGRREVAATFTDRINTLVGPAKDSVAALKSPAKDSVAALKPPAKDSVAALKPSAEGTNLVGSSRESSAALKPSASATSIVDKLNPFGSPTKQEQEQESATTGDKLNPFYEEETSTNVTQSLNPFDEVDE